MVLNPCVPGVRAGFPGRTLSVGRVLSDSLASSMASPLPDPSSPDADRINGAADGPPEEPAADTESVGTVLRRETHRQHVRQIRDLTLALAVAEQRERTRIAQRLHDHLQPLIHGARMWAEAGRDAATGRAAHGLEDDPLDHIIGLLDEALQATRSLTVDLHPPALRTDGLAPALEWLADHMAETHGLTIGLALDPALSVSPGNLRMVLFDAARELLFNVVKHAGVRSATLTVEVGLLPRRPEEAPAEAASVVRIEVADAGCGFDPSAVAPSAEGDARLGLASVCERIHGVGGSVDIDARPGRGTCVCLRVPLPTDGRGSDGRGSDPGRSDPRRRENGR